jgi:DNA-binding response OmpR family regulator
MSTTALRFVVVDDSLELLDLLEEAIAELVVGPVTVRVFDEPPTLDELAEERPDVVLLDLRLGREAAGWELIRELRTDDQLHMTEVIMWTADLDGVLGGVVGLASMAGVHLLQKPFSLSELEKVMGRVIPARASSADAGTADALANPLIAGSTSIGPSMHPDVADA